MTLSENTMSFMNEQAKVYAWSQDFIRAVRERPWWARHLLRLAMGQYAYREFIGIQQALADHHSLFDILGYELTDMDYHKDKAPLDFLEIKEKELE